MAISRTTPRRIRQMGLTRCSMASHGAVLVFRENNLNLPRREEMLAGLRGALEALLFKAEHLAFEESTVCAHNGGLAEQATFVLTDLESAAVVVRMYDALQQKEEETLSGVA